jgi:single-stranded-DNA-specific exonuclease
MNVSLTNKFNDNEENYSLNLLLNRGVSPTELTKFLNVRFKNIENCWGLKNLKEGIELVDKQLKTGKKFALIVDPDVDGYTSSAVFYQYMKRACPGLEIDFFIHSLKQHGLGDMMDRLLANIEDYSLVVCPDSSSNDFECHEKLGEYGVPVLCLDHHDVDEERFSANAVVINNQISPNYKSKELTGVGVTWQFCRGYDETHVACKFANDYLDLVAVGLIGDMASILDPEIFTLVTLGLSSVENKFLQATLEKQSYSMKGEVTPMGVAFYVCPLYNAMIRVGEQEQKERLFRAFIDGSALVPSNKRGAKGELVPIKEESVRECVNAKAKQNREKEKVANSLAPELEEKAKENNLLVVELTKDLGLPQTMTGLLAMQIADKFQRPTLVGRVNDGVLQGSIRGLNQSALTDLKSFLQGTELFEYVQGHPQAAGFGIEEGRIPSLLAYANKELEKYDFGKTYYDVDFFRKGYAKDLPLLIEDIGEHGDLWGQGNSQPLIYVSNILVSKKDIKVIGKNKNTVKITNNSVTYMFFRAEDLVEKLLHTHRETFEFDIVGTANINTYNGITTDQIFVKEWEIVEDNDFGF